MHDEIVSWLTQTLRELPPRRAVLEVGSLDVNGSVRHLFAGATYLGIDLKPGPGVDQVADAVGFQPPFEPDTVVSFGTLEHAPQAAEIIASAHRMLAPAGYLLLSTAAAPYPQHSQVDGGRLRPGEFYAERAPEQLEEWLQDFTTCSAWQDWQGNVFAVARR